MDQKIGFNVKARNFRRWNFDVSNNKQRFFFVISVLITLLFLLLGNISWFSIFSFIKSPPIEHSYFFMCLTLHTLNIEITWMENSSKLFYSCPLTCCLFSRHSKIYATFRSFNQQLGCAGRSHKPAGHIKADLHPFCGIFGCVTGPKIFLFCSRTMHAIMHPTMHANVMTLLLHFLKINLTTLLNLTSFLKSL